MLRWIGANRLVVIGLLVCACGPKLDEASDADSASSAAATTDPQAETSAGESSDDGAGSAGTTASSGDASGSGGTVDPGGFEAEGWYLLAVSTVIAPDFPLQYLTFVTAKGGELNVEMQPLSLDVGSTTTPREPLIDYTLPITTPLDETAFTIDLGEHFIPGQANPITGSDILALVTMQGEFVSTEFACGRVSGQVLSPIMQDLAGSTFALTALPDRETLPERFRVTCE